jgi:hypothetical protein
LGKQLLLAENTSGLETDFCRYLFKSSIVTVLLLDNRKQRVSTLAFTTLSKAVSAAFNLVSEVCSQTEISSFVHPVKSFVLNALHTLGFCACAETGKKEVGIRKATI